MTIDEVARHLNVSKTSLRRWTNDGRLPCLRVGVRGERRFRLEDVERFVRLEIAHPSATSAEARGPGGSPADPVHLPQASSGDLRHVSTHFHDRDELWRLFWPYLLHHLQRHAPILYIIEEGASEDFAGRLRSEGWSLDELKETRLLDLRVPSQTYLRTGVFAPERMIDFIEAAILERRALGDETMLVSGEMTWCLSGAPGVDGMFSYERRLNDLLAHYRGVTIVCHYDLKRLDVDVVLGALCSHPHVHLPDRIVPGYYNA